jgi:ectoine hydroxylase-related dioxygenase (phytanoyl-CoA dioxygenase family)
MNGIDSAIVEPSTDPRFATSIEAARVSLENDGYAVIEGVGEPAQMDRIAAEVEPYLEPLAESRASYYGGTARRAGSLIARSPELVKFIADSPIIDVVEALLLRYCPQVLLAGSNGHEVASGGENQPLHRDEGVWYPHISRRPSGPEYCVNVMIAVTDFTQNNGATRIIPGSNHWEAERRPTEIDSVTYLEMPRGSVGFWLGSTYHGASINHTAEARLGITVPFNAGWLRPIEAQHLVVPPALARTFPRRLQPVLGYEACNNVIGKVNWRSPMHLLSDEAEFASQII